MRPGPGKSLASVSYNFPIGEGEPYVVVARGTNSPDGAMTVLSAQSLESVHESTAVVTDLLFVGYPLVLIMVAFTSYWLSGRALAPVEAIRRRVATIDGTNDLSARVPVSNGGDEITRLAITMNSMLGRLEKGAQQQRRFVGDASHELRSPLATIRAAHEIQTLHPDVNDWPSISQEVLHELDRVDRLVADMLMLARSDERGLRLQLGAVDLGDLVQAEASRIRRAGTLVTTLALPPVRVLADEHHIARALRNLTDNAARHASHGITLELRTSENTVEIVVGDDGPGVAASDRDRIFERFVRLDESRARASGGTGLGLPIAREIAKAHGGDLILETSPGGAKFILALPQDTQPRSPKS
ncbi:MAG: HAMP domain-containing sensor histidine kinase [Aeromicrobium sp.]